MLTPPNGKCYTSPTFRERTRSLWGSAMPVPASQLVRFDRFELDLRTGELRKGGIRIRLQEQPLQVLQALLENPGELVTCEELQKRIWPADTFVDFDHGLHAAVNKIREALGDSAETPRYIETLPRRGYRFIYPPVQPDATPPQESAHITLVDGKRAAKFNAPKQV